MPRKIAPLVDWTHKPPLEQAVFLKFVGDSVTSHSGTFPTPPYTNTQLNVVVSDLNIKYANRFNGAYGKQQFIEAKALVNTRLHQMADYADETANGDPNIITQAGFNITDVENHPAPPPEQPVATLKAEPGRHVAINLIYNGTHKGNLSFVYVVGENADPTVDVNGAHITVKSADKVHIITDGHMHEDIQVSDTANAVYVKALAQNTAGKSTFSPAVTTKILD